MFFRGALLLGVVLLFSNGAQAADESSYTGDSAPVKKTVTHKKHKITAKKKKSETTPEAPAVSTNDVAKPAQPKEQTKDSAPEPQTNSISAVAESSDIPVTNSEAAASNDTSRVATLAVSDLRDYDAQLPVVKKLIASGLQLTTEGLSYKYGSSDPKEGGMDCSGTIYYLLTQAGIQNVPRDASEMYKWVWKAGLFQAVVSSNPDTFELSRLKPGNLLFWTGTYKVDRDPPVTHVMIYLGKSRHTGKPVMVGASEGRRFEGKSRYGVSVFDFTMPTESHAAESSTPEPQARFIGYGSIPGLEELEGAETPK